MHELTVGSLFAGIGGFDLGFERAGMRTLWQVEQSEFCRAVLAKHFPDAERYEDVRDVGAANLAPVDLICGGFPCQDISLAGKGGGLDGARSGLWSEYARIIGELEPRWVVVENVPALTSRGLDRVLRDLAAIGYDAEWDCLPASAFGAPHRRDRVWIVAYPQGVDGERSFSPGGEGRRPKAAVGDGGASVADAPRDAEARSETQARAKRERVGQGGQPSGARSVADPEGAGREARTAVGLGEAESSERPSCASWWRTEPSVGRVAHGVPARVDRLSALGNALVPQIAQWIGQRILDYEQEQAVQ